MFQMPPEAVVHTTFLGGGFGRRFESTSRSRQRESSKVVGRPVQLIWTREEDMQHDYYGRPA